MIKKLLTTAAVAGAVFAGVSFLTYYEVTAKDAKLPKYFIKSFDKKHNNVAPDAVKKDDRVEWFRKQDMLSFEIPNSRGQRLKAYYLPAEAPSDKFIICSHGYRCTGKSEFRFAAKYFHDKGYNVLFPDHQASGDSEGKFISFGRHESEGILLWIQYLIDKFGKDIQIALYGISLGSATVMILSDHEDLPENVKFIIADCGFTNVESLFTYILSNANVPAKPLLHGANVFSKAIDDWDMLATRPIDHVSKSRVPILFVHGENDDFVPSYMGCELYHACTSEKDYISVPNAGHAQAYEKDSELCEEKFNEFAEKYFK